MSGVSTGPERSIPPIPLWRNRDYLLFTTVALYKLSNSLLQNP